MDASTRLYKRLGEIPEDPNDPKSLADLLVCAFGAFERYYVCWKTKSGDYRQDGYDLPPALKDWLYPTDGTTRDFASLQVVFGRGEEYFASDKDGKLEYKEPEIKKANEDEEMVDKPALRRARTVSFLRPLSDVSTRSETNTNEAPESKRSSSVSSRRASRPPSLSYSRTSSTASISLDLIEPPSGVYSSRTSQPSIVSQWDALGSSNPQTSPSKRLSRSFEMPIPSIAEGVAAKFPESTQEQPSHATKITTPPVSNYQVPEGYMLVPINQTASQNSSTRACACHSPPLPKATYVSASTQTVTPPSPPRTALRIDTTSTSHWSSNDYSAGSQTFSSPAYDDPPAANPIFMGRMMNYFSKPGYQLGDSLASGYQAYQATTCENRDTFSEEIWSE